MTLDRYSIKLGPDHATKCGIQRLSRFAFFKPPTFCCCLGVSATSARAGEEERP
jgi:hypothetical protein